jgi:Matrixin
MDRKFILIIGAIVALLILSYPILAAAFTVPANEKSNDHRPTIIVEVGEGKDTGLIKVTQIHYAKPEGKARPPATDPCYKLSGWKWTTPIKYTINPNDNLKFFYPIEAAESEWDSKTSRDLFVASTTGPTQWDKYTDGKNSILFGNYGTTGVIAVTRTWYNRATKTAVESDILFDNDFAWGDATGADPNVMDIQNIATHEIGHTLGLSDVYTNSCTAVTMFGYSSDGEISKRTLETPDINALLKIYPNL